MLCCRSVLVVVLAASAAVVPALVVRPAVLFLGVLTLLVGRVLLWFELVYYFESEPGVGMSPPLAQGLLGLLTWCCFSLYSCL